LDEVALNGNSGWDDVYPEINFFKNAPVCTRTDLTFYTILKLRNADKVTFTLTPWNSPTTHAQPLITKDQGRLNGDGLRKQLHRSLTCSQVPIRLRLLFVYPQVLLDYAEASAMAGGGPTPEVMQLSIW